VRDRRYFVLEVSDAEVGNMKYFSELCATFTDEMKTHLLNFYLRFDTTGFNVHEPAPESDLKAEIMESQLHSAEVWIKEFQFPEEGCLSLEQLFAKYIAWCDEHYITGKDLSKPGTGFARRIAKYCSVSKGRGGKHEYQSLAQAGSMTIRPEERRVIAEKIKKKQEIDAEIKRRSGQ
jgi:hypothetical protein